MAKIRLQTLKFYKSSRDAWKQKHKEKQKVVKSLKIKIRDLTKSRDNWKNRVRLLECELKKNEKSVAVTKKN